MKWKSICVFPCVCACVLIQYICIKEVYVSMMNWWLIEVCKSLTLRKYVSRTHSMLWSTCPSVQCTPKRICMCDQQFVVLDVYFREVFINGEVATWQIIGHVASSAEETRRKLSKCLCCCVIFFPGDMVKVWKKLSPLCQKFPSKKISVEMPVCSNFVFRSRCFSYAAMSLTLECLNLFVEPMEFSIVLTIS